MSGILGLLLVIALIFIVFNVIRFGVGILLAVVTWALAGWLASRLVGGDGAGLLGNILLGVIGGAIGSLLLSLLGLGFVGDIWIIGPILVGVIGAVLVILIVRAVTGNRGLGR
jgi:uncharacterized membrane protein YeaQ/YmgE (transglycosylase-associated protein family)